MALVQKAFSDIITFSRSSNATRVGPTGLVEYAPHNLLTYSQELGTSSGGSTVTANVLAAPDGTVTADKITGSTSYWAKAVSITSGTITFSIFVKSSGDDSIALYIYDGEYTTANVNLANGTITGGTIQNVGNGWYRCSLTKVISATVSEVGLTNISASGVNAWGAQLAVGPYPLDYTPTTSAAVYGPRFDYDPVTLAARGLLVEEQRTNLVTYSEDFSNAAWIKRSITLTANQIAPSGTVSAFLAVPSTASFADMYIAASASSTAYTTSIYAKASGKRWVYLLSAAGASANWAWFDLTNGVIGTVNGSGLTATITACGNGWYRCTVAQTSVSNFFQVGISDADGSVAVTGSGSNGVLLWGAQLEAGSFAASYIPTLASTVTRSADVASVNTLSPFYNAVEGTIYGEVTAQSNNRIAWFRDPAGGNYGDFIAIVNNSSNGGRLAVNVGGATQVELDSSNTISAGSLAKVAGAYKANDFAVCLNGGPVATDTSGSVPGVTTLLLGYHVDSVYLNGHLRRIAYYPRKLSSAELQALTA